MIKVKKFAALALAAVMLCPVSNTVRAEQAAAEPIAVSYDKSKLASADDRVTIRFSLPADTAANGAEVRIAYPEDKLLVGGVETGTLYESAYMSSYEDDPGEFKAFALNDVTFEGGGDIILVTFAAAENAAGNAELTVTTLYTTVDLDSGENEYKINISLSGTDEAENGGIEPSATLSPSQFPASGGGNGTNSGGIKDDDPASETAAPSETESASATEGPSETEAPSAAVTPASEKEPVTEFTDIDGHWAEESITELAGRGLINGFDDGTFRPDESVTRAQFTKMLADLEGLDTNTVVRIFEDVPINSWYAPYVTAAYAEGIALGDGAYFRPDSSITREEMAVMAARCMNITAAGTMGFIDIDSVSEWAKDAVNALSSAGIISGFEDGTFRPGEISTRAEAAAILLRLDGAQI